MLYSNRLQSTNIASQQQDRLQLIGTRSTLHGGHANAAIQADYGAVDVLNPQDRLCANPSERQHCKT